MRNAVQEVGGAVERVDIPGVAFVRTVDPAAFLADERVAGARSHQFVAQCLLGLAVGGGDEIRRPLDGDLQLLDLAEIAIELPRRLACGFHHHVEEGGVLHGVLLDAAAPTTTPSP